MPEPLRCDHPAPADHAQLYGILVAELTDFVVFLIDPEGCVVSWNPGVERVLGYPEEEWVGQPARIVFTPEDQDAGKPEQELAAARRDGRTPDIRWHQRKDGSRLYVEGTMVALKNDDGKLLGCSKVMRDITERKHFEDELRNAHDEAHGILESIADGFVALDRDWRFTYVNAAGERLIRETRDQVLGRSYWEVFAPTLGTIVEQEYRRAVRDQVPVEFENFYQPWQRWFAVKGFPTQQGGLSTYFQDITERKQKQAILERQSQELIRSNAELQQFAYVTSHDLQEPLRTMVNFSQLLVRRYGGQLGSDADQYLDFIISGAQRMNGLVDSLLAYSRVLNEGEMKFAPVPVEVVVQWATMNLHTFLEENGAIVTYDQLPTVKADQVQLVQLFQNLISNAVKYRRAGEPPRIHISAERVAQEQIIAVQDNGIGIEQKYAERIFGVFKRLHGKEIPGTGIGLAIAKRIVENHDGRIWVQSQLGQGATFYVALPADFQNEV